MESASSSQQANSLWIGDFLTSKLEAKESDKLGGSKKKHGLHERNFSMVKFTDDETVHYFKISLLMCFKSTKIKRAIIGSHTCTNYKLQNYSHKKTSSYIPSTFRVKLSHATPCWFFAWQAYWSESLRSTRLIFRA